MTFRIKNIKIIEDKNLLNNIPKGKVAINCLNAHSYNIAQKDSVFANILNKSTYLIPDGISIVWACKWLNAISKPKERIVGWDLFSIEMEKLNSETEKGEFESRNNNSKLPVVMFFGSSEKVLKLIRKRMNKEYPLLQVCTYSPPYKRVFSDEDNRNMIEAINKAQPDLLWVGMTAPKQEKWIYDHWDELNINCHVGCIGAVFDFYAGTIKRAPIWWQNHSLEWLYRLLQEPKRMWKRYLLGNPLFIYNVFKEWIK